MNGPVALHGGGEYVAGDERAMDALLAAAVEAAGRRGPARIVIVPTAAARQRPELAASHGMAAFSEAAGRAGARVEVAVAMVADAASADDPAVANRLGAADLVHLPGGDPDLIPALLPGSRAWAAILGAHARGAVVAGASAGAMALAECCWTPSGPVAGLGLVPGHAVVPHFVAARLVAWRRAFHGPAGLDEPRAWLGLDERTLVIGRPGPGGVDWRVVGPGRAHLVPAGAAQPVASAGDGETLRT